MERATERMSESNVKPLSPRDRYLAEQKEINRAKTEANKSPEEIEDDKILEDAEAIEKDIDKNMGDTSVPATKKVTMTKAEYLERKQDQEAKKAIQQMLKMQGQHLTEEQQKELTGLLQDFNDGIIKDPVLCHLIEEKVKTAKDFITAQVETKALQEELMKRVTEASNKVIKLRGIMEHTDMQILQRTVKLSSN